MTSGLRSLRDKTLTYFEDRLAERASRDEPFERLYQAVNLLAEQVRTVAHEDKAALYESGMAFNIQCAVTRRHSSAGANPARQLSLQPVAVGADDGGNDIG